MKISDISITHRRLPPDPPFRAGRDTRPRRKFEATIVRVKTGRLVLSDKPGFGIEMDEGRPKATKFA